MPIHEIAKKYQIHLPQVTEWEKALLGNACGVCKKARVTQDETKQLKKIENLLHKQIGQLQNEVDFVKDACHELGIGITKKNFLQERESYEHHKSMPAPKDPRAGQPS